MFDQWNASLPSKSINFFKTLINKNLPDPKRFNASVYHQDLFDLNNCNSNIYIKNIAYSILSLFLHTPIQISVIDTTIRN